MTVRRSRPEKVHENRVRRMARRQGLELRKSGRRDPLALDFGRYVLVDAASGAIVAGEAAGRHAWTLEDIERYLRTPRDQR